MPGRGLSLFKTAVAHFLLQGACMTTFKLAETLPPPYQPPDERRHLFFLNDDYSKSGSNEWVRIWSWSVRPSFTATEQREQRSGGHTRTVQMNEVKFRAPSAHPRHPWFIRKVWWRWLFRQPRSALWVTESTGGKYWGNPSFTHRPGRTMCLQYYQMWCLCLPWEVGASGGSFFGKYQISSPPASPLLHSQIQPDHVLPTGLRGGGEKPEPHGEITLQFIQVAA